MSTRVSQPITSRLNRPITFNRPDFITSSTDNYSSLEDDSEDDYCTDSRNVSHQQQFFSELHSPGRSHYTKLAIDGRRLFLVTDRRERVNYFVVSLSCVGSSGLGLQIKWSKLALSTGSCYCVDGQDTVVLQGPSPLRRINWHWHTVLHTGYQAHLILYII